MKKKASIFARVLCLKKKEGTTVIVSKVVWWENVPFKGRKGGKRGKMINAATLANREKGNTKGEGGGQKEGENTETRSSAHRGLTSVRPGYRGSGEGRGNPRH